LALSIRSIPVAAMSLSFTSGCGAGGDAAIVGTWDAVQFLRNGEDVSSDYFYSEIGSDGCLYSSSIVLTIGPDLVGGLFTRYSSQCPDPEDSYTSGYGNYVTAAHTDGRWLIAFSDYLSLDCTLNLRLDCAIEYDGDYDYDYDQRIVFERR
jgi:hypothetical protein